ncbi:hypothetical protein HY947_05285 [Candidatus Gottesmanbacteria bacterium]|nr:hypothetical protein [Candidatus Gottesmanbacteria bacterium]
MKKLLLFISINIFFLFLLAHPRTVEAASLTLLGEPKAIVHAPYTIGVVLSGGEQTLGTDTIILYDHTMLRAVTVAQGSLYPTYTPSKDARVNNDKGKITLSGSTGFNSPIPATGVFGKITFSPLKKGKTMIRFDYAAGDTSKTGVIDFKGLDLLSSIPKPLALTIENESPIEAMWRFVSKLFPFLKK